MGRSENYYDKGVGLTKLDIFKDRWTDLSFLNLIPVFITQCERKYKKNVGLYTD